MKIKLGTKGGGLNPIAQAEDSAPSEYFPEFSISGDPADALVDSVTVGDEITATVKLRVVATSERKGRYSEGCRVEFEVLSLETADVQPDESEDDAESALEDFKAEKDEAERD